VFLKRLLQGQPITIWGDGSVVRDYLYISDVAEAFLRAAHYRGSRHVFNIGSGQGHSLNQVLARLEVVTGRHPEVIFEAARGFDVPRIVLDSQQARTELDWVPRIHLDEGIRLTWEALQGASSS
jgi:UDP-glucose 4-epimerase